MKIVETYSGSRYMIDEEAQTFRRLRGQDASHIDNDEKDQEYIQILELRKDCPMQILWLLDGKEKVRISTPIKSIEEVDTKWN